MQEEAFNNGIQKPFQDVYHNYLKSSFEMHEFFFLHIRYKNGSETTKVKDSKI
jgi:hypothetical protein